MQAINLPTKQECTELVNKYVQKQNIKNHIAAVTKLANWLGDELAKTGEKIDRELLDRAARLHDVAKDIELKEGPPHHAERANEMLKGKYPAVAEVIRLHASPVWVEHSTLPLETAVLNYADKRILHDKIATLEETGEYSDERYGPDHRPAIAKERLKKFETWLFSKINKSPNIVLKLNK